MARVWGLALLLWAAGVSGLFAAAIGADLCPINSVLALRPKIVDLPSFVPALIVPPLTPSDSSSPAGGAVAPTTIRFTVLDANLWLLPPPWAKDLDERMERFLGLIASLSPDIIALQEVWLNPYLSLFRKALPGYWAAGIPPFLYNRSGLVVFSRFPIREAHYGTYPWTRDHSFVETLARKGVLQVDCEIGGRSVRLLNTHLYASRNVFENRFPVWQFEILRRLTAEVEVPTLVTGDLNIRQESLSELNEGHFITERMAEGAENQRTTLRGGPRKIDYVLGRLPEAASITIESHPVFDPVVSDHLPVLATVTVRFERQAR